MLQLISKFALLILVLGILVLLVTGNLFSPSPMVIAAQILAIALSVWARRGFQKGQFSIHADPGGGQMMSKGPYRFIRHPMYAAALLLIWSSVLGHWSMMTLVVGLVVTLFVCTRIMMEEGLLRERFPEYAEYARATKRIIPFVI